MKSKFKLKDGRVVRCHSNIAKMSALEFVKYNREWKGVSYWQYLFPIDKPDELISAFLKLVGQLLLLILFVSQIFLWGWILSFFSIRSHIKHSQRTIANKSEIETDGWRLVDEF